MSLLSDLALAVRHLRRAPGYGATAVVTFALAIGANSAIFSAVHAVLLRPLPIESPGEVAVVWQTDEGGRSVVELTYRHLREWTSAGSIFTQAAVMGSHNWTTVLTGRGEPAKLWFNGVSAGFFETLGVAPLLGRTLTREDDLPNARAVVVLNHDTWVRRFGADPNVVGTTIALDGDQSEVVGVMPAGFDFPRGAEFWAPGVPILAGGTPPRLQNLETVGVFYLVGRLRPGLDPARARTEIDALEARLDRETPGRLKWGARTVSMPLLDHVFGPVRPALRVLWAAVAVLLLIACANVSGLMMTRVSVRRREHAIRLALGASRRAIARLWVAETLLVAAAGGALGLVAADWLARAIVALAPDDVPRLGQISIDGTVALFTFAAVVVVTLLTGAIPLRHSGSARLVDALEGERTTTGRRTLRVRSTLLVVQMALSVVLLVAAGLVVRSYVALQRIDLGFSPRSVLAATVQPRGGAQPVNAWMQEYLTRLRVLPGVESAGAVYLRPLMLGPIGDGVRVYLEGQPVTRETAERNPTMNHQIATPGYFETLGIALRAGRFFTAQDTTESPRVVIVGESAARRLWPGQDPIGKRLSMAAYTPGVRGLVQRTVVGVVSDVRYRGLDTVELDIYDPALQVGLGATNVVVRTAGAPLAAAGAVRALARELDAASIVDSVTTMDAVVGRAEAPWRLTMWMFVLFAGLAFGLAALGLFSLVALDVAHRRHEFAIRLALGASGGTILRTVLTRTAGRVAAGIGVGLGAAWLASRAMTSLLFGVSPGDVVTYVAVVGGVLAVVALAAYIPARRASDAQPQALLRT